MKEDRFLKILDILAKNDYVSVESLSKQLFVSMPTIRRDLNTMQDMGLVVRSHGGVIQRRSETDGGPAVFRMGVNTGEKLRLDKAAASYLHDNCMVFLDESTTTLHMVDQISAYKNVTIVTNNITVLQLAGKYRIPTICLGGETSYDTMSFYGPDTEDMIGRFGIDIAFFSSSALTPSGWIADYSSRSTSLRRRVLAQSSKKVFLVDKSKFMKSGQYMLLHVSVVDDIITNAPLPPKIDTGSATVTVV